GNHVWRHVIFEMEAGEDVAVIAFLFAYVAPLRDRPTPEFVVRHRTHPGGTAGAFLGSDLLPYAPAGQLRFLDAHPAENVQPADSHLSHQIGRKHVLLYRAVELEGIAFGRQDVLR